MSEQAERAFRAQEGTLLGTKVALKRRNGRWYKDIGLGYKTPKEAIEGSYIDKKCPFTGQVSIRGRILTGTVASARMDKTVIVRREYLHYISKYKRYEKRHSNIPAHCSPCFAGIKEGDTVVVGECRPLSKTVRFNVIQILKRAGQGQTLKQFTKL